MTALPPLYVPEVLKQALAQSGDCGISISGGKDSQALLTTFTRWHREQRLPGHRLALHADLGRAEWVETPAFVATLCAHLAIPLVVVRRTQGDLLDRLQERMQRLAGMVNALDACQPKLLAAYDRFPTLPLYLDSGAFQGNTDVGGYRRVIE